MQHRSDSASRGGRNSARPPRFVRLDANSSSTAGLLEGCAVVTVGGERLGVVDHVIVDILTSQLRYVVLRRRKHCAEVTLPWHAMYFDSAAAQLVFYTLD